MSLKLRSSDLFRYGVFLVTIFLCFAWCVSYFFQNPFKTEDRVYLVKETKHKPHVRPGHPIVIPTSRLKPYEDDPYSWRAPQLPAHLQDADQEDPDLVAHIRNEWLLPPSRKERVLDNPDIEDYSQFEQSPFLDAYFKQKEGGFFVEVGAADGEKGSNTLLLEKKRGWGGLLIEADPGEFREILEKRRHAYKINCCLSPTTRPMVLNFTLGGVIGGLTDHIKFSERKKAAFQSLPVQCFPLYSILSALGQPHVNVFSLDVEGPELVILDTLPIRETDIDMFMVEVFIEEDHEAGARKRQACKDMLLPYGYKHVESPFSIDLVMSKV